MKQPSNYTLDKRCREILQAVIGYYIMTGEPVGSRKICKQCCLDVSPATVRNIMADLEEMGYLTHPHISAGRVPTDLGYRFYVDHLTSWRKLSLKETDSIDACKLSPDNSLDIFLEEISLRLSSIAKCIGVVMSPNLSQAVFKKIEFIHLKPGRVLVVLISHWGYGQQKIIETEELYTQDKLDQMARRINRYLCGLSLADVRKRLRNILQKQKDHYHRMLVKAAKLSRGVLEERKGESRIYIQGRRHILRYPDFADRQKIRTLLNALEEKEKLVRLLDKCLEEGGVHIFIGSEMKNILMEDLSLITSSYSFEGRMAGLLGVIGPTRLEYSCIIPMVSYAAQAMSKRLQEI